MAIVLGISITHNGGVALIRDGEVITAIQAERISRRKRQPLRLGSDDKLIKRCVQYCMNSSGIKISEINAIALSTPWNVQNLIQTDLFEDIGGIPRDYIGTFYVPHHFSHMEYIVHFGSNEPGIVLVVDGSGSLEEDRSHFNIEEVKHPEIIDLTHFAGKEVISAYLFDGSKSSLIYRFSPSRAPIDGQNSYSDGLLQSIGHYWEWASLYCCGSQNEAGKVMGLAAFGKNEEIEHLPMLSINKVGKIKLDYKRLKASYKYPNMLQLDLSNSTHHQNAALRVQTETEQVILELLKILQKKHQSRTLYISGGVALNVVANERIISSGLFNNIVLNGSVEDNGSAIGAALAVNTELGFEKKTSTVTDYLGHSYNHDEIIETVKKFEFNYQILEDHLLIELAANSIFENKIFGWFQGKSEFGPRALGNRSILANPTNPATKATLDHFMKCRDRYRPYAPVVTEERAREFFELDGSSPVMMRNVKVLTDDLPAITHVDGTARVQTVNEKQNPMLHRLLLEVEKKIGYPILLNTSFNLPGEPIVETPHDAMCSFEKGALDFLILGNVVVKRSST